MDNLNNTTLNITEIFYSLQGEAREVGIPTVFVRLTGCPLRCNYCDTAYAFKGNNPLSINKIQHDIENSFYINWKKPPSDEIYLHSFIYVYGLYSRHGRFYPPYNFIPDINYREFIQNAI